METAVGGTVGVGGTAVSLTVSFSSEGVEGGSVAGSSVGIGVAGGVAVTMAES